MSIAPDVGHHPAARSRSVTAVLGPTNTGKTHLAIERMLGHESGVIGLPLRLLAREVYNRVVDRVGADAVALVTGEEKIKPANPRYWVSTVEAMPRDLDVAFVAIDEVQLAADLDRGHVFTDRILRRRGREETLLLGAATMRPILTRMMPNLNVVTRPRLSHLAYSGQKKITRLPRRSAVVAFSAQDVYAIAELIRRQRGGAAVVLGALSPRTRNAQVGLYQNGDVDFLVATDAIGMGLNLDVDHVAFAARRKFDGWQFRNLNAAEMGQVAGRAGRHMRDGTFGVTGRVDPLDDDLVSRIESHDFEPVRLLQWRNATLQFDSLAALHSSLSALPREDTLTRAPASDDVLALEAVSSDLEIADIARGRDAVERLWDVCQVPDYRKIAPANHADLVATIYSQLMRRGAVDEDWFARQIGQCDRDDGDIDTLSNRIAHVRTWTFVANRPDWLADPDHWQERTRAVEDRLSDALHERLAQRFVDRRTSVLARSLRENPAMEAEIDAGGEVTVEGHHVGRLDGLRFSPDPEADGNHLKAIAAAARRTLSGELTKRAERLAKDADEVILLSLDGTVTWRGSIVGRVEKGETVLNPRVVLLADEQLSGAARDNAEARLQKWIGDRIETHLGPLKALEADEAITGMTRGIAFQLGEALGVLERPKVAEEVRGLSQEDRAILRRHGVRFGAHHIYLPVLLKPAPRVLAAQLWALHHGGLHQPGLDEIAGLVQSGRMSIAVAPGTSYGLYRAFGFRACGKRAVRIDILERIADQIRAALSYRPEGGATPPPGAVDGRVFQVSEQMTSLAGCAGEDFAEILKALGYRSERRPAPTPAEEPQSATAGAPAVPEDPASQAPSGGNADTPADAAAADSSAEPEYQVPPQVSPETPQAAPAADPASVSEDAASDQSAESKPPSADDGTVPDATAEDHSSVADVPMTTDAAPDPHATAVGSEDAQAAAVVDTGSTEMPAQASEPSEIVVWRPGRRPDGPRRQKPARRADAATQTSTARTGDQADRGHRGEGGKEHKGRKGRKGRPDDKRQARREDPRQGRGSNNRRSDQKHDKRPPKAPDPLSPFAALKELRDELAERERRSDA
ncbi:helicase-related protein [Microbaculum marinum]|uniref:Helicase-related protein n=1 Tax=Microbaculum marinum TaxID=1764581 RepID=A0AAW9RAH0_9HYPH